MQRTQHNDQPSPSSPLANATSLEEKRIAFRVNDGTHCRATDAEQTTMALTYEHLTAQQVADLLGVTIKTVYTMRDRGRGPASYRRGRRLVYRRSDVDAFLVRERERTLRGETVPEHAPGAYHRAGPNGRIPA
jgi:excisionase family DNA binding protein